MFRFPALSIKEVSLIMKLTHTSNRKPWWSSVIDETDYKDEIEYVYIYKYINIYY